MSSPPKPRYSREKSSYKKFELDEATPTVVAVAVSYDDGRNAKLPPVARVSTSNSISVPAQTSPSTNSGSGCLPIPEWPAGLRTTIVNQFKTPIDEEKAKKFLTDHGWPPGLQSSLLKSCQKIPIRFFIVDDSGSMGTTDGKRTIGVRPNTKVIDCTRWSEVTTSLMFHAELAEALQTPAEFRLLNGADPIIVGLSSDRTGESMHFLKEVLEDNPGGKTPLCQQIASVVKEISSIQDSLRSQGKKAAVIIATDGEATDGDVSEALKPLEDLPVWVVVRLCTDEPNVIKYWEQVDNLLELELDVLDDLVRDSYKISKNNPWLVYGEAIHRLREFGTIFRELDIINEARLTSEQMRVIMSIIYSGGNVKDIPHPDVDWFAFINYIKNQNSHLASVFDSSSNSYLPWSRVDKLNEFYGNNQGTSAACTIM